MTKLDFLAATKVVKNMKGTPLPLVLAASGTVDTLLLYLRAHAALAGAEARIDTLPFGTLGQRLRSPAGDEPELFLLTPWDFVGELDWRSGIPARPPVLATCLDAAAELAGLLAARPRAGLVFVDAPAPPLFPDPEQDRTLARAIAGHALALGAELLPAGAFSLPSYLASGCPLAGAALDEAGRLLAARALALAAPAGAEPAKLLVTDCDNVLWQGVVAEDGLDGIAHGPEGKGWRSFLYQTLLLRLKNEGVLVAAVTRNRPDEVQAALAPGRMVVSAADLVAVIASYQAKSAQIRALADSLSLGLDAVVFVDDNPVELVEVGSELPAVRRMAFPAEESALPAFLAELSAQFRKSVVTAEDRKRTQLYRQRLEGMVPAAGGGADLAEFLRGLAMILSLREVTHGERARALQLINKTNQFNLNGRRFEADELEALLAGGHRLFTGELADRTGSHGEVLVALVAPDGMVESLVMSCRVLMRRAETAFLAALHQRGIRLAGLRHQATEKNEPFRKFLAEAGLEPGEGGVVALDAAAFAAAHGEDVALFTVDWKEGA